MKRLGALPVLLAALLLVLCLSEKAQGGEFVRGNNGYYFRPGSSQAYTDAGYWYKDWYFVKGCYGQCGYWTYTWAWYSDYKPVKLDIYSRDISSQALAMAADRDQMVLTSAANLAIIDRLGLNVNIPNYGQGIFQGRIAYNVPEVLAVQSQTVDTYGNTLDINLVNQAIERGIARNQDLTGQMFNLFGPSIGAYERTSLARESRLTSVGIAQALAPKSTNIERKSYQIGPARMQAAIDGPAGQAALQLTAAAKCASCHAGQGEQVAAFDITKYDPLTADDETSSKVKKYIRPTADLNKHHCPPGKQLGQTDMAELIFGPPRK